MHGYNVDYFIGQLAEAIVLDDEFSCCSMCASSPPCDHQVSGLVCRGGVKKWLVDFFNQYKISDETSCHN